MARTDLKVTRTPNKKEGSVFFFHKKCYLKKKGKDVSPEETTR